MDANDLESNQSSQRQKAIMWSSEQLDHKNILYGRLTFGKLDITYMTEQQMELQHSDVHVINIIESLW